MYYLKGIKGIRLFSSPAIPSRPLAAALPSRRSCPPLSPLAFGTAGIGGLYRATPRKEAMEALAYASRFTKFFDSALHYGAGCALSRLGEALGEHPERVTISIKTGRVLVPTAIPGPITAHGFVEDGHYHRQFDYSYDGTLTAFLQSIDFLNAGRIQCGLDPLPRQMNIIAFVHDPGVAEHGDNQPAILKQVFKESYPALRELKKAGRIKRMGIACNEIQPSLEAIEHPDTDIILLAGHLTLLSNGAPRAPACIRQKTAGLVDLLYKANLHKKELIIGGLANSGLAYGLPFYNYEQASEELIQFQNRVAQVFKRYNAPIIAGIMQFPLLFGEGAVTSVLSGARNKDEVYDAVSHFNLPLPDELWEELFTLGYINPMLGLKLNKSARPKFF